MDLGEGVEEGCGDCCAFLSSSSSCFCWGGFDTRVEEVESSGEEFAGASGEDYTDFRRSFCPLEGREVVLD